MIKKTNIKSAALLSIAFFVIFTFQNPRFLSLKDSATENKADSNCGQVTLRNTGATLIPVPAICKDSLCRILVGTNASLGDFGPGYLMDIFYKQNAADGIWVGGPNLETHNISFSAGGGVNGNLDAEGVFIGGFTADGGSLSIMDDSILENSPDTWTVWYEASDSLTEVSIMICEMAGCEEMLYETTDVWEIDPPGVCDNGLCAILMEVDAGLGNYGPGLIGPAYIREEFFSDNWIGGPVLSFEGLGFSDGKGTNGDIAREWIFHAGETGSGGYVHLFDDYSDRDPEVWALELVTDDALSFVNLHICPQTACSEFDFSVDGEYAVDIPGFCDDSFCSIFRWTDGISLGSFMPGFTWPVFLHHDTSDNEWMASLNTSIENFPFSSGIGSNGDGYAEPIIEGKQTTNGGFASLLDDSILVESNPDQWTVAFNSATDLSEAVFHVCTEFCEEHKLEIVVMEQDVFLPLLIH